MSAVRPPVTAAVGDRKRGLIILYGLHRYYRDGWASLHERLLDVNPEFAFDVALLTWPLFACTDRDRTAFNNECLPPANASRGTSIWLRCDGPLPAHDRSRRHNRQ
jgi:hypothetical protein